MDYKCLRCGKHKELRKGKKPNNNRAIYLAVENKVAESKVLLLRRTSGTRKLCPGCLSQLSIWLQDEDTQVQKPMAKKAQSPLKSAK